VAGRGTLVEVGVVDVLVLAPADHGWAVLVLRRGPDTRCSGAWETVHGRIEPGETPVQAARRELREETGLSATRWYNVMTHSFYLHRSDTVQMAVVFCAFVDAPHLPTLGPEHVEAEWLPVPEARARFAWPSERVALDRAVDVLGAGHAGPLEDVLRIDD
jgi:8-oxo-dGTP pyrophosphatase MutT (NUDIX family)